MDGLGNKAKLKKDSFMLRFNRDPAAKPSSHLPKPVKLKGSPGMDSLEDNP